MEVLLGFLGFFPCSDFLLSLNLFGSDTVHLIASAGDDVVEADWYPAVVERLYCSSPSRLVR